MNECNSMTATQIMEMLYRKEFCRSNTMPNSVMLRITDMRLLTACLESKGIPFTVIGHVMRESVVLSKEDKTIVALSLPTLVYLVEEVQDGQENRD